MSAGGQEGTGRWHGGTQSAPTSSCAGRGTSSPRRTQHHEARGESCHSRATSGGQQGSITGTPRTGAPFHPRSGSCQLRVKITARSSKLVMLVRFPSPAPVLLQRSEGVPPVSGSTPPLDQQSRGPLGDSGRLAGAEAGGGVGRTRDHLSGAELRQPPKYPHSQPVQVHIAPPQRGQATPATNPVKRSASRSR